VMPCRRGRGGWVNTMITWKVFGRQTEGSCEGRMEARGVIIEHA
jgi:hypothetical protein